MEEAFLEKLSFSQDKDHRGHEADFDYDLFKPSFGKASQVQIIYQAPNRSEQRWTFDANSTGQKVKQTICDELGLDADDYQVKIFSKNQSISNIVQNESIPLKRDQLVSFLNTAFIPPTLQLVPKPRFGSRDPNAQDILIPKEIKLFTEISSLVGESLHATLGHSHEARAFRSSVARKLSLDPIYGNAFKGFFLTLFLATFHFNPFFKNIIEHCHEYVLSPLNSQTSLAKLDIQIIFHRNDQGTASTKISFSLNSTLNELRQKVKESFAKKGINIQIDAYLFKVAGQHEFLIQKDEILINFEYTRTCAFKDKVAVLKLVPFDPALKNEDFLPAPSHMDILLANVPEFTVPENSFSIHQIDRPFKFQVTGCERVPLCSKEIRDMEKPDLVLIPSVPLSKSFLFFRVSFYHGDQQIHSDLFTEAVPYSSDPRWGNWLIAPSLSYQGLQRVNDKTFWAYPVLSSFKSPFFFSIKHSSASFVF